MTQCHSTLSPYEEKPRHTVPAAGSAAAPDRERPESGRGGQGDYGPFNEFRLELEAYNYKQTVLKAKHVVLRTMPDEDFYSKEFRTVEIVGRYLVIKDFLDHDSFWIDLESVSEGVAVVIDKRDISEQDDDPLFKQILW